MDILVPTPDLKMSAVYLRWGGRRNRANEIAASLGLTLVDLKWQAKHPLVVAIRYPVQFVQTLMRLIAYRPRVVISQHTQPFCSLAAAIYCRAVGAVLITDCHNGPFIDSPWNKPPISWINRLVYRWAKVNVVHNKEIHRWIINEGWPGKFVVLYDVIPTTPQTSAGDIYANQVFVMCSWSEDEPISQILGAARLLPSLRFVISGQPRERHKALLRDLPNNVRLSGFVSDFEYDSLLKTSAVAVALSTRKGVLTRACHEAIGAGTPVVTSDDPATRCYLEDAAEFSSNSAESIAKCISSALTQSDTLREKIPNLIKSRREEWIEQATHLGTVAGVQTKNGRFCLIEPCQSNRPSVDV
jgi:glycosyltransferase involved in cell wall biosynthesis